MRGRLIDIKTETPKVKWLNDQPATPVSDCTGKWIWCDGEEPDPRDLYMFVRGEITFGERIKSARLHVSAEDRYLVYLNGKFLGRGPARSLPKLKSYDTYDVSGHLKTGRNVIAIRAYHYGFGDLIATRHNYASGARAGVWSQLEVQGGDGKMVQFGTDGTWRMRLAKGWTRNAGQVSGLEGTSFTEILTGGIDPLDWMMPDFDDTGWQKTNVISPNSAPWIRMEARYTPLMAEKAVCPKRVVKTAEVLDNALDDVGCPPVSVAELLRTEIHLPPEHVKIEDEGSLLAENGGAAVVQSAYKEIDGLFHPVMVFDFGRQVFGFPQVTLTAPAGVIVDMTYGQRILGNHICIEHKHRLAFGDRYITRMGRQTWQQAEYKQFRYLQVIIRSPLDAVKPYADPVSIHAVDCNWYYYPAEQRGSFECSEPLLGKAWQAAVDTVYLETEDVVVCDAWRERACHMAADSLAWPLNALYAGYGDLPVIDRKLLVSTQVARDDGFIDLFFPPKNFSPVILNGYLTWSSCIKNHLLYTGRCEVTEAVYPFLRNLMHFFEPYVKKDNLLHGLPGWIWTDWSVVDNRSPAFTVNANYIKGLEDAAWVASELGKDADARKWRDKAQLVRQTVKDAFWNKEKGLFADSCWQGSQTGIFSEISNGMALNIGLATGEEAASIAGRFAKRDVPTDKPTPMYIAGVAEGLFQAGFAEEAIHVMKRLRPMLECEENPTFWETWGPYYTGMNLYESSDTPPPPFSPADTRSRVHGTGAGIALVLHRQILGVRPTAPGFRKCIIEPRPGDLTWARGTVPTPHGDIRVEWKIEQGRLDLSVDLPDGVERASS